MKPVVVMDANVAITANGRAEQASEECIRACTQRLAKIQNSEIFLLDTEGDVLREYRKNTNLHNMGPGDAFFMWIFRNQYNVDVCRKVHITPHPDRIFEEFPDDNALKRFDPDDRKFVAVALASGDLPPILNATDRDWQEYLQPLERHGIYIEFLCPELMKGR